MPAFTGPPGRSEIPSLRGVLVSSLAYLFSFRITNASPLARCQGLFASLGFPLWEHIKHTTGFGESQGKRQFQIAQDNMKLKIMTQRAYYLQFNLLDISL